VSSKTPIQPVHVFISRYPPFTIQRLCELCVHPHQHYHSIGKYLRAIEKTLLVTSTTDAFPPLSEAAKDPSLSIYSTVNYAPHTPSTPLFSPLPFLHRDARRSKSLSPPPSPLILASGTTITRALGLVDEMDDPGPGHLRDHPTTISSVTTARSSLGQRFVRAKVGDDDDDEDDMDDKENIKRLNTSM
jgi:serine/threonine-protein phosphatase 4 regulatory subunit 2